MLLCPLSFLDIEPLSQKCGEYRKLTTTASLPSIFLHMMLGSWVCVIESITDFPFLPLSTEKAVYNEEVGIYQIIIPLSCDCVLIFSDVAYMFLEMK